MSASSSTNNTNTSNLISEVDDVNMFQAARRGGRRNALGDLGEQILQGKFFICLLNKYYFYFP